MASEATAFINKVSSAGDDYFEILGIKESATDDEIKKAYRKMALLLHPDKCQEDGAEEAFKKIGEAYSKLLDEEWWQEYLPSGPASTYQPWCHESVSFEPKATPVMSQKQRKQERREKAKQRYAQSAGPNAHNVTQRKGRGEKPVPQEVPKEWLFETNAPDPGNVMTTNNEQFEEVFATVCQDQHDDGSVLNGQYMKNRHISVFHHVEGEAATDKARVQGSNGTTGATSNGAQAQQASKFEGLGDTGGFGGFGIAGMSEWLQMPNLSLCGMLSCCISRPKWREQRRKLTLELCLPRMLLECGPNLAFLKRKNNICWG